MKYLLDTTTISDWLKGDKQVKQNLLSISPVNIYISPIVRFELAFGLNNKLSLRKLYNDPLQSLYAKTNALSFDKDTAEIAAEIRYDLKKAGKTLPAPDILIAASALQYGSILVTSNTKHFRRIKLLSLTDWKIPISF